MVKHLTTMHYNDVPKTRGQKRGQGVSGVQKDPEPGSAESIVEKAVMSVGSASPVRVSLSERGRAANSTFEAGEG